MSTHDSSVPVPDPRLTLGALHPRELRALLTERRDLLALLRHAGPASLTGMVLLTIGAATTMPVIALLVSQVVDRAAHGVSLAELAAPLVGIAVALLVQQLVGALTELVKVAVSRPIDGALRSRLRALAIRPRGIAHLEEPAFQDDAQRAGEIGEGWWVRSAGTAVFSSVVVLGRLLGAVLSAGVLAAHFPVLAVLLFTATLLNRSAQRRQWTYLVTESDRLAGGQRRVDYYDELAAGSAAAKEIRLFGLAGWLIGRRADAHWALRSPYWALRRSILRRQWLTIALSVGCGVAAFLVPGLAAARGELSAGDLMTCLTAAAGIFVVTQTGMESFDIEYGKGALAAVQRLERRYGDAAIAQQRGLPGLPRSGQAPEVRLENVSFTYPTVERPVLSGLNLEIRPGEVLAVVGVNGAGKTTLTKLIAGLYEPGDGRVTVDGRDLTEVDAESWRRRIGTIYQDYVRYPATARDNIAFGAPETADLPDAQLDALVRRSTGASSAVDLLDSLPQGLGTLLWRTGSGGRDLSGGQWQKLAVARTLHATAHGRDLVILDEPTANMDVKAELEFFRSVVEDCRERGVSVVLISHRLSTIRDADRIVVLDGGRITETGNHLELLAADGTYAHLWRLQAARFDETSTTPGHDEDDDSEPAA
ncbi:ABC transporter ATP-binding protein [Streptomyces spongiae]|uniref:ABC transporter ATP-binding protein n=1 Tax=Streptomyces spongiae TaxID=565072 RepID=A0A5N8X913_9ACTN|nr:ABC transporter ATP-binding protein [Streptomyces spongiae]MPY55847.1 ABC transporter ATP-binding protein [Streptomyces spongiae]